MYRLVELILRFAIFLTFIGHGLMAMSYNEAWIIYLKTIGFSDEISEKLLAPIGVLDIIVAILILVKPNKPLIAWCFIWGLSTALIRPLSGESILEFIERGANWGAPLALCFLIKIKVLTPENSI